MNLVKNLTVIRQNSWIRLFAMGGFSLVVVGLILLTPVRYQYQNGMNALNRKEYEEAHTFLVAAHALIPGPLMRWLPPSDQYRMAMAMGKALYYRVAKERDAQTVFNTLEEAIKHIQRATAIEPMGYKALHLQARITARLEQIFPMIHPKEMNPYHALPLYRTAIHLRPAGITIHYEMLKYMDAMKITDGFDALLGYTVHIYPPAYHHLKKEPFFTEARKAIMKEGVIKATEMEITPRESYSVLSSIYLDEKDYAKAAHCYAESLRFNSERNTWVNFLQMGKRFMQAGESEKAHSFFVQAMEQTYGEEREKVLKQIYAHYKREEDLEGFMLTCGYFQQYLPPFEGLALIMARCRMEMGLYELAKATLIKRRDEAPTARLFALLAEIAARQKRYDEMELTSHRATVLAPDNGAYWLLFSKALYYQKKYDRAEQAAAKAIELAPENSTFRKWRERLRQKGKNKKS